MRLCISVKIDGAGFIQEEEEEDLEIYHIETDGYCHGYHKVWML